MPGSDPEVSKRGFDDLVVKVPLPTESDFTPSLQCDLVEVRLYIARPLMRVTVHSCDSTVWFQCHHYIEIVVLMEGDRSLKVEIPVSNVLPNDNEAVRLCCGVPIILTY